MQKTTWLVLLILVMLLITGCVSVPPEWLSGAIEADELSDHVDFLAQPALKGRKPKTWESATVQKYLEQRFRQYGLRPWPGEDDYRQKFIFGKNMIAFMPGADPNLADEIVILAAHFDHVGKGRKGVYHGACDNASGVAALLEIAEKMTLAEQRPKRSVCFAAFDSEERMAFGAFAFTCRDNFKDNKIAAVVNIDMLGRDFLDVIKNSLFVVGTEDYPQLRDLITRKGTGTELKLLPLATELLGPAGDHIAFEHLDIPVVFFTCGYNKDYHRTTDTPEKINYGAAGEAADIIAELVSYLANEDLKPTRQTGPDDVQLETLGHIAQVTGNEAGYIGLEDPQAAKLLDLAHQARQDLLDKTRLPRDDHYLGTKIIASLAPAIEATNTLFKGRTDLTSFQHGIYSDHSRFLIDSYRQVVEQVIADKPGIFDNLDFKSRAYDITDRNISFVKNDNGLCQLDILVPTIGFVLNTSGIIFKSGNLIIAADWRPLYFEGTEDQTMNYCLLQWRKDLEDTPYPETYHKSWARVLRTVTGEDHGDDYRTWIAWWTKKHGWDSEEHWLDALTEHDHPQLAVSALYTRNQSEFCKLIEDPNKPAINRHLAMHAIRKHATRDMLLSLAKVVDDETPLDFGDDRKYWPMTLEPCYPFANNVSIRTLRESLDESLGNNEEANSDKEEKKDEMKDEDAERKTEVLKTIGDYAASILRDLTAQDFSAESHKWRKWIEANVKKKASRRDILYSLTSKKNRK